jgi:hypothetical protein
MQPPIATIDRQVQQLPSDNLSPTEEPQKEEPQNQPESLNSPEQQKPNLQAKQKEFEIEEFKIKEKGKDNVEVEKDMVEVKPIQELKEKNRQYSQTEREEIDERPKQKDFQLTEDVEKVKDIYEPQRQEAEVVAKEPPPPPKRETLSPEKLLQIRNLLNDTAAMTKEVVDFNALILREVDMRNLSRYTSKQKDALVNFYNDIGTRTDAIIYRKNKLYNGLEVTRSEIAANDNLLSAPDVLFRLMRLRLYYIEYAIERHCHEKYIKYDSSLEKDYKAYKVAHGDAVYEAFRAYLGVGGDSKDIIVSRKGLDC